MLAGLTPAMIDAFSRKKEISISNIHNQIEAMEQELARLHKELKELEELTPEDSYAEYLYNQWKEG